MWVARTSPCRVSFELSIESRQEGSKDPELRGRLKADRKESKDPELRGRAVRTLELELEHRALPSDVLCTGPSSERVRQRHISGSGRSVLRTPGGLGERP